jgi:hypothetical protein
LIMSALRVVVEGEPLPDDDARGLWRRFSDWMEGHPGDLAGFAREEGFASVHPEMHDGAPALVLSRVAAQKPYGPAPKKSAKAPSGRSSVSSRARRPR